MYSVGQYSKYTHTLDNTAVSIIVFLVSDNQYNILH